MKKLILSVLVAGSLMATSCKKAKEAGSDLKDATEAVATEAAEATEDAADAVAEGVEDAADAVSDAFDSALEGVTIPTFENEEVTEHLKAYADYAKEYIAAGGDVVKNADLAKKGTELAAKGKELVASLDEESAAKFKSVMSAIQSKMAPAK